MPDNPFSKNFDPDKLRQFMQSGAFGQPQQQQAQPAPQPSPMPQDDQGGIMKQFKLDALKRLMMGG